MAELTTKQRKRLPDSAFAVPEERKYPVHDVVHQRNALARVHQHGTREEMARVHDAIKKRNPELWRRHMEEHHPRSLKS